MGPLTTEVMGRVAKEHGWGPNEVQKYLEYDDYVALAESDRNPSSKQHRGGPGRGRYQTEVQAGKGSGTNLTWRNRVQTFINETGQLNIPRADMQELTQPDPDFSKLSEDTQQAIFLISNKYHPTMPLDDVGRGKAAFDQVWVDTHWGGPRKDRNAKKVWFNNKTGYSP